MVKSYIMYILYILRRRDNEVSPRSPEPNRAVGETDAPVPAERRLAGLPVLAGGEAGGAFPQRFRADALDGQRFAEKGERLRRPEKTITGPDALPGPG
jgi:hypothetical protein